MEKYVFGVMSRKWELQADDVVSAKIAMCLWVKQNIPVAIYEPQRCGFLPKNILDIYKNVFNPEKVRAILETIKEIDVNNFTKK